MQEIILRASSVRSFHDNGAVWYRQHVLGEDKFLGNTSTFFGSCLHKFAETYYTLSPFNPHEILNDANEEVDKALILSELPITCKVFEEKYLNKHRKPDLMEHYMSIKFGNITFQGTCDAWYSDNGGVLVDYKSSSRATKDMSQYLQQLQIYSYLLSTTGRETKKLRIVSIVRQTKTIEPRIAILECDADIKEGKRLVTLMVNRTRLALDNPDFAHLIFTENIYSFLNENPKVENSYYEL